MDAIYDTLPPGAISEELAPSFNLWVLPVIVKN